MRVSRVWYNRMRPRVEQTGYAREAYDRQAEGQKLAALATKDGFVADIRGGFVHVATQRVAAISKAVGQLAGGR